VDAAACFLHLTVHGQSPGDFDLNEHAIGGWRRHHKEADMFSFRSHSNRENEEQRQGNPEQRQREDHPGRGSEDWGQEWGEDWRGEREPQRGRSHPSSSGYGGYQPAPEDSGYRSQERSYPGDSPRGDMRGGRAMHWREGMERDRAQRGGQPTFGGGYFSDLGGGGGQSYSGGQRVYPNDPGYRQRAGQPMSRRPVGPKGYRRPDERVREDICERLAMNPYVDVRDVTVDVAAGVVTLGGTVRERREKYVIEEISDAVFGVMEVENHLRVLRPSGAGWPAGSDTGDEEALRGTSTVSPDRTLNKS
jgi:hypothetical protein